MIDISINAENFRHTSRSDFARLVAEVCEDKASVDFDIEVITAILDQLGDVERDEVLSTINQRNQP